MPGPKTFHGPPDSEATPWAPELGDGVLLHLTLPSDSSLLCVVRATVDSLTTLLKFSEADCRGVTRAVDEAMANIVRHSYGGRLDRPIGIRFRRLSGETGPGLEILFWDEGLPIDSSKLRPRRLDEVRPGGLGLHFMRQAMDTVEFSRVGGANRLRMVKFGGRQ
jgi:serine/threonine-protein kinase RsbW